VNNIGTVKEKYGFLPTSVWEINNEQSLLDLTNDPYKRSEYSSGAGGKKLLSEFSPNVAKRIIKYWSEKGDLIFDPFAGKGTRALMAKSLGRKYIGYDISKKFVDYANRRINRNVLIKKEIQCEIRLGDSRKIDLKDNSIDFIYSCPPYWDSEKYEKCEGQMSEMGWNEFIKAYSDIIKQCYRVLKDQKFCVFIIADFRKYGKFIDLHTITIDLFKKAGFQLWDIVINKLRSMAILGVGSKAEPHKYNVKIHEYILVFKKTKNPINYPNTYKTRQTRKQ
jgi:DNA modification methylase